MTYKVWSGTLSLYTLNPPIYTKLWIQQPNEQQKRNVYKHKNNLTTNKHKLKKLPTLTKLNRKKLTKYKILITRTRVTFIAMPSGKFR